MIPTTASAAGQLADRGFVSVPGLLGPGDCRSLADVVGALWESSHERSKQALYVGRGVPPGTPHLEELLHQWLNPHRFENGLGTANLVEAVRPAAEMLLDAPPVLFQDLLLIKRTGQKSFPWHQDFSFWPVDRPCGVVCWIPLAPSNRAAGGLRLLPESHKLGPQAAIDLHRGQPQSGGPRPIGPTDEARAICPDLKPGDGVFFSPLTYHCSDARTEPGDRIAWSTIWLHPEVRWDHSNAPSHPLCRSTVHGELVDEWRGAPTPSAEPEGPRPSIATDKKGGPTCDL